MTWIVQQDSDADIGARATFPVVLPTSPAPRVLTITATNPAAISESPYDASQEVQDSSSDPLIIEIEYPPMKRAAAEVLLGRLGSLRGSFRTFYFGDPVGYYPRGTALGNPVVDGAGQTGSSLATKGWGVHQEAALRAGDWLQVGNFLYKSSTGMASDAHGNGTIDIFGSLRASPADDDPITLIGSMGLFRLLPDQDLSWTISGARLYVINSFKAREAF